jgi:nucleoside-diphosphate-sugar epimerase
MSNALIGSTGFVGSNLQKAIKFEHLFNSKNVHQITENEYDMVICAAPSAVKWKANQNPEADLEMIQGLLDNLKGLKAKKFVHISTVDVYENPKDLDEDFDVSTTLDTLHPYGKHRYMIEEFVRQNFDDYLIIRPGTIFGMGMKKNFIFDMTTNNALDFTHKDSEFQFSYVKLFPQIIEKCFEKGIKLLNINSEPVTPAQIAQKCFDTEFTNDTGNQPPKYNIKSKHAEVFGGKDGYLYSKSQVLDFIDDYLAESGFKK